MDTRPTVAPVNSVQWVVVVLGTAAVLADVGPTWAQTAPAAPGRKASSPMESAQKPPPRITPSTKTTKVVAPLDDDGYVDYVAALNEIYGRDVTPENNAGLLFVRASRIEGLGPAERKRFFELLHCPPLPEEGDYLTDIDQYVQKRMGRPATKQETDTRDRARRWPWSLHDFPLIAEWIESNEKPLRLVVEGTRRPKCFLPFVLPKGECLFDMPLPAVQASRTAANLLAARAMLELRNGLIEQAENDLLACHRLGRLIGTTPYGIGALVGLAIDSYAWEGDIALMNCAGLSAERALAYQRKLRELAPLPRLDEVMDKSERLTYLQSMGVLARPKALNGKRSAILETMPPFLSETTLIDWSEVLEIGNDQFDYAVGVLRQPSIPEQRAAWERFHRDLTAMHDAVKHKNFNKLPLRNQLSRKAMSQEIGRIMITSLFPAARATSEAEYRVQTRMTLDQVGLALTAYDAVHGTYPKELKELVPDYIAQVPPDPFTEQALHYERRADGFLLYSVGPNGKDDGGAVAGEKETSDDIAIRVVLSAATILGDQGAPVGDASIRQRHETVMGFLGAATALFSFAVFFGVVTTLVRLFVTRRLASCLAFVHVALAVAGLVTLTYAAVFHGLPFLGIASLILFAIAALAGLRIFVGFHLKKKNPPVWLWLGHGTIAITATALLWVATLQFGKINHVVARRVYQKCFRGYARPWSDFSWPSTGFAGQSGAADKSTERALGASKCRLRRAVASWQPFCSASELRAWRSCCWAGSS
jgi:hypothetical protein